MQRDGERDGSGGDHLAVSATQLQGREDLTRGGDDGDGQDGTDQTRPAVKSMLFKTRAQKSRTAPPFYS